MPAHYTPAPYPDFQLDNQVFVDNCRGILRYQVTDLKSLRYLANLASLGTVDS